MKLTEEYSHSHIYPLESGIFMPTEYAAVKLLDELVDNGVLVREGSDLRFLHESVQEYFAAVALRDDSDEELAERAPVLSLARPDERGPIFETLVTWAGLTGTDRVANLVRRLQDRHPLLAAHLAREATLTDQITSEAKRTFISMLDSGHEGRRRVGLMGMALLDLENSEVMSRLVDALQKGS